MDRDTAKQEIRANWRRIITNYTGTAKARVGGRETYICPFCGHGAHGDGLKDNPKSNGGHGIKCFGCGFSGDILDLIQQARGVDYNEALKMAAGDIGIEIDTYKPDRKAPAGEDRNAQNGDLRRERPAGGQLTAERQKATATAPQGAGNGTDAHAGDQERAQIPAGDGANAQNGDLRRERPAGDNLPVEIEKAPETAPQGAEDGAGDGAGVPINAGQAPADYSAYYKDCAKSLSNPAALSYLAARGISPATAAAFEIGFDGAWISPTAVKNLQAQGKSWRPPATPRIIVPITKNHYLARDTRTSEDDRARANKGNPKYKDYRKTNETGGGSIGFFNLRALYGDAEAVFVVEGVFDALSIIEAGAQAVAINSTSNAGRFVKRLQAEPTRATLILCFDNDDAGRRATATIRDGAARLNIPHVIGNICAGQNDPNDALRADRQKFTETIQRTQAQTAAKPDSVSAYIENLIGPEISRMRAAADRKTGFEKLDDKSGGLYPGLYVIAATSSLGKTTFALQVADNLAAAGHDVLFFSLEQSRLELVTKSFSRMLRQERGIKVNSLTMRKGYAPDKLQEAARIYKAKLGDRMSIIEGNFKCNISFIGDYIRRYMKRNKTRPIIFIDYLQILQPADDVRAMSTKETVDSTVTELKRISRELDLTVFIISSVNRANYMTPIDFESLKESGGIEYTADVIWGLQLQCLNDPLFDDPKAKIKEKRQLIRREKAENPRRIELLCLKNRYGIANFSCGFMYYPDMDLFAGATRDEFYICYDENPLGDEKPQIRGPRR